MDQTQNGQNMNSSHAMCKCPHHKVAPISFIVIGALFLLQGLGMIMGMWPTVLAGILFIVIGVMKMKGKNCKCC